MVGNVPLRLREQRTLIAMGLALRGSFARYVLCSTPDALQVSFGENAIEPDARTIMGWLCLELCTAMVIVYCTRGRPDREVHRARAYYYLGRTYCAVLAKQRREVAN